MSKVTEPPKDTVVSIPKYIDDLSNVKRALEEADVVVIRQEDGKIFSHGLQLQLPHALVFVECQAWQHTLHLLDHDNEGPEQLVLLHRQRQLQLAFVGGQQELRFALGC